MCERVCVARCREQMPPRVVILTCATHWTPTFANFYASALQGGYDVRLLEWGKPWRGWAARAAAYTTAAAALAAEDAAAGRRTLLVVCDAYDVLVVRPAVEFAAAHARLAARAGTELIVGAEWFCGRKDVCGAVPQWWKGQDMPPPRRRFINAGFLCGAPSALAAAYAAVVASGAADDQRALADYVSARPRAALLDSNSLLVHNVHVLDATAGDGAAAFVHFPGPALKWGVFRHYNVLARRALGARAHVVAPPPRADAAVFALQLVALVAAAAVLGAVL